MRRPIRDGDSEIIIAGGQESMSLAPHVLPGSREGQRMGDWALIDSMIVDGLFDVYNRPASDDSQSGFRKNPVS